MLVGWWHLVRDLFSKEKVNDEFVSYNALRLSELPDPSYEMLGSKQTANSFTSETLLSSPDMLRITPTTNQTSLQKPYTLRSSMLSSTLSSPETDAKSSSGNSLQFSPYTNKGMAVSEDFHHALSPKPPLASYQK